MKMKNEERISIWIRYKFSPASAGVVPLSINRSAPVSKLLQILGAHSLDIWGGGDGAPDFPVNKDKLVQEGQTYVLYGLDVSKLERYMRKTQIKLCLQEEK